jgi:hypothetical protein
VDIYKIKKDMKRLRKFNESVEEIDYDYIYECFGELIDDGKAEIELIQHENPYVVIRLKTIADIDHRTANKTTPIGKEDSPIYNHIQNHNTNNELLQDLKVSLDRLSDKYPDYKLQFSEYSTSIVIEIFKNVEEKRYPF